MDNIREKLVELLQQDNCPLFMVFGDKVDVLADYLIAHGVTVQEWIPVTERLPKEGDIVLCYMEFGEQRMAQWDESENCWAGQLIDYHKEQVTHWMPKPTPPKGE